ncbi:hypothetical protein [Brevibacillus brevis]|uniref:hypothetical protein n=1 Tax=Brevibacillus brevis TaxID=1393 RepID=UPI0025A5EADC|nr:hypothetical protein [Brevibacillus brevis]WJQ84330.1 hypothetical protein QN310_14785 [Brevibacillus brevis]
MLPLLTWQTLEYTLGNISLQRQKVITATMKLNPLANPAAAVYSNIFLLLAILIMGVWILYRLQFRASKTLVHTDEPSM